MNIKEAVRELEDRALPEIVELLKTLDRENKSKAEKIKRLEAEVDELKYGGF